jgi:hypothetical protein
MNPEQQLAVLDGIKASVAQAKEVQKQRIGENVGLVVDALKKIESDIRSRFDEVGTAIEHRVNAIKDGRDGINGQDGKNGKDGRDGKQGVQGVKGKDGRDGRDGVDGIDGISVTSAHIDFDGSLVIGLSSGVELNVGEVLAPSLAESIKVITNGGGTSQSVIDTLASLQTQINNLIPSQTGNSGKYLTTNGTALSWASIAGGGLSYQGTWNASTNSPTLASSTGTNGYYYIVSTAGSTNLNGITDWQIGDWLLFNGTVWQKIDQSDILQTITSTDGSVTVTTAGSNVDLAVAVAASTTNVICQVRNTTGSTLTKGTAVYISGATGQIPTVSKALATSDATSAQTLGLMTADLANNTNGYVTVIGLLTNMDTSAYTDGAQLYLSGSTAGTLTATKTYAPTHLVYVAVVEHAHPTQGKLFVKVQNGYELDEIHNVSAQSPSNGQTIIYNATTSLWEKGTLTAGTGISVTNGAGSITVANTGVTSVSGTTGRITSTGGTTPVLDLTSGVATAGTTGSASLIPVITIDTYGRVTGITTASNPQGTVTSVTGTSPVVSSGGATPAISLATAYGDTLNPYASKTANYFLAAPNGSAGVPTFRAVVAADIPTLNQNTSGSAASLSATLAIGSGGTGQTTANTAFNALAPSQTSNSGKYLTTDGSNTSWASVVAGASITNDTTTSTNVYPLFAAATSGTPTTIYTGNTKYLYKPSTGELTSPIQIASNGLQVNSQTVSVSYTIASGNSATSAGPITLSSGVSVTISSGSRWVVL